MEALLTFVSYAQNFEDVLLRRALRHVATGFYIDIGAWEPDADSVTRTFYDSGWQGINVEPIPDLLAVFLQRRPRDINLGVAVTNENTVAPFFVIDGTGLSTLNAKLASDHVATGFPSKIIEVPTTTLAELCRAYAPPAIHFLKIDCEGSERAVLEGADFEIFRPWIVVIEATKPRSPEPNHGEWEDLLTKAAYSFVWFDGLNRFYVAAEHYNALAPHFMTPPNCFDDFIRVSQVPQPPRRPYVHTPSSRPSLAETVPQALTEQQRVELTVGCRDADVIPKVEGAGQVTVQPDGTRVQMMHNGVKVIADGYYGSWMTDLITRCHGHHEPQEERMFHAVMRHMPADATMIELGGFWAYYTCWFLQHAPGRRAMLLEPEPLHRAVGEGNLRLNGVQAEFVSGFAGAVPSGPVAFATEKSGVLELPRFSVPKLMDMAGFAHLNLLHCDTQGAELDVLEGCRILFSAGHIDWVFISTHAWQISNDPLTHQRCLAFLQGCGATIVAEHDVYESFSGDGLIVARFCDAPADWEPVALSYARYGNSFFRNPSYDLAAAREVDPRLDFIEATVEALYKTVFMRTPGSWEIDHWTQHLSQTGDFDAALGSFLQSDEFVARGAAFSDRYLRRKLDSPSFASMPVNSPLRTSGAVVTCVADCSLGPAGSRFLLPDDKTIAPAVLALGAWNPQQVAFVHDRMAKDQRYLLVDIGANVGLFSRQLLNRTSNIAECFVVEPDPENFAALQYNMREAAGVTVHAFNLGLGLESGAAEFYRDRENCGNYSVHPDAMRDRPFEAVQIELMAADEWMNQNLPAEGRLVWKSDTQGSDEMIVAATPWEVWNRVDVAVMELWRIRKPTDTRQRFLDKIGCFPNISLGLDQNVTVADVAAYLDNEDWNHEDLYVWR